MPIYEFQCRKCGKTFEQLMFPSDPDDIAVCPTCGENDTCKLMSSFSCGSSSGSSEGASESSHSCASHGGFS
jgi:putative FmdB family regulatory protein